jgi:hypothetical protein
MPILYAVVARGATVLAEHSAAATNAGAVARQVLERLPGGGADSHVSYTQDRYVFHAKRTDGITALCMADDAAGRKRRQPLFLSPHLLWSVAPPRLCFVFFFNRSGRGGGNFESLWGFGFVSGGISEIRGNLMCCAGVCQYARLRSLLLLESQTCFGGLLDRVKRSKLFRLIQSSPIAVRSRIHGVQRLPPWILTSRSNALGAVKVLLVFIA